MARNFREPIILDIVRQEGKVTVEGLAERLDVTVQTIRKDLSVLAEAGRLERVSGGAIIPSSVRNIGYTERRVLNAPVKDAIARRCAQDIPDGSSVFLNIGTTTEAVAQALVGHRDLLVVTNNIHVANILMESTGSRVVLAGGEVRKSDGGLTGELTIQTIRQFRVDYAVIGCSALNTNGDILDFDISEVGVSKEIIRSARHVSLVADSSKFSRSAPVQIASLKELDSFYTDVPLSEPVSAKCDDWKTRVVTP